jgi:hypothetical protein
MGREIWYFYIRFIPLFKEYHSLKKIKKYVYEECIVQKYAPLLFLLSAWRPVIIIQVLLGFPQFIHVDANAGCHR